ncbi:MAG: hypothetical protein Q9210_001944 [Variospora velana]
MFVRTICPSINAHIRRTKFSTMVKNFNMSYLVHDSSRSLTARILTRLKEGLEVFAAPRTSFAINCLAALSKCQHLRQLNLILVTETLSLRQLLHSISKLTRLESLSMRCKDAPVADHLDVSWPPHLKSLEVSGSFTNRTLDHFRLLPRTLTSLTIHNTSKIDYGALEALLKVIGHGLESLHLGSYPIGSQYVTLSDWLRPLPKLKRLYVYLSRSQIGGGLNIFDGGKRLYDSHNSHPLKQLELDGFDLAVVESVFDLVADGYLGCLRQVTFYRTICTSRRLTRHDQQSVHELDDLLRALAREDGTGASMDEDHAGAKRAAHVSISPHEKAAIGALEAAFPRGRVFVKSPFPVGWWTSLQQEYSLHARGTHRYCSPTPPSQQRRYHSRLFDSMFSDRALLHCAIRG